MKPASWLLALWFVASFPLIAQKPTDPASDIIDPPSRVGRLNWLTGDVSFQPAGLEEWSSAILNYPLTTNDHLSTNKDARAEIHVGSTALRLDSNSNFGILNLDDNIVQVSLTEGALEIRLRTLAQDDTFEIATPDGAITLLSAGEYRVDTNSDRDATMLTVRAGTAELYFGPDPRQVSAGYTAYFQTDQAPIIRAANLYDDFDTFTELREGKVRVDVVSQVERPYPRRTRQGDPDDVSVADLVSEGMTGAEDLASYGTWQYVAGAGPSWLPPVDSNWTPYSDGSWGYVEPWGWTWIDAAPWGFAPFHYGRWTHTLYGWAWVPGPKQTTQVFAPALVTFIGGGPADNVSWFPLSPRDLWIPPWRPRPDFLTLQRTSTNRLVPGAVLSMSPRDFISGARAHPSAGIMPEGQIIGSSPLTMPIEESVLVRPSRVHPPAFNRPLIARTAPPPPPITFVATLGLMTQNRGRPPAPRQVELIRRDLPATVMSRPPVRYARPLTAAKHTASVATPSKVPLQSRPNGATPPR